MISKGCIPYRSYDYMYDPIFTVSGPTDHYKAAIVAKMASAKFQLCPVFANMFSDLPTHPRIQLVQRRQSPQEKMKYFTNYKMKPQQNQSVDVAGADRAKFFVSVVNLPPQGFVGPHEVVPKFTIERVRNTYEDGSLYNSDMNKRKCVHVQTKFRESCSQTEPWQPPYKVIGKGDPEILKLDFLQWSAGLPVGVHEVQLLERARMKRAWENYVKPDIDNKLGLQQFRDYVEALERDEWAFREQEIQEIQQLRLHLLEKMLEELTERANDKNQSKINRLIKRKEAEKLEKLEKIRKKAARELRKLELSEMGVRRKYQSTHVIDEHKSKNSELYAPFRRHGQHPKRWHLVIDEQLKKYRSQYIGVEEINTLPRWLDGATELTDFHRHVKTDEVELCLRETTWTAPVLKELHEELQDLRKLPEKKPCSLRVRNENPPTEPSTPSLDDCFDNFDDPEYLAIAALQTLIQGRAIQTLVYEGRENCKELIQELKHSVGLLKEQQEDQAKIKRISLLQQRDATIQSLLVARLKDTLGQLQGHVVGSILDFLNKEFKRLIQERRVHAICLVKNRERNIREAGEAGRRQKEMQRRREHDEMFKQIVKITQDSIDVYLQEIITEGMEFTTELEAKQYVWAMSDKVQKEVDRVDEVLDGLKGQDPEDELIADLVHHFVLPEVEKRNIREKLQKQQKHNLKTVHEAIYSKFETTSDGGCLEQFDSKTIPSETSIEMYLRVLASQDDDLESPYVAPSTIEIPLNRSLETIPETEHETSASETNVVDT